MINKNLYVLLSIGSMPKVLFKTKNIFGYKLHKYGKTNQTKLVTQWISQIMLCIIQLQYFSLKMNEVSQHDQQQQPIIFGDRPVLTRCPSCLSRTVSDIVLKAQYSTVMFSALVFILLPNVLNIIGLMFAFVLGSVKKHRCSVCQFQLGTDGKFMMFMKDEVYSFHIGKSGIILTKKILVSALLTVLTLSFLGYFWMVNPRRHLNFVDTKWESFVKQCQLTSNQTSHHALSLCEQKYDMKSFMNWTGYVMRVKDNRQSYSRFYESEIVIYLKMTPEIHPHRPDLLLEFDKLSTMIKQKQIEDLHHGDQIVFNATFSRFNNRGNQIMMYIAEFEETGKQRFVEYVDITEETNNKKLRKGRP